MDSLNANSQIRPNHIANIYRPTAPAASRPTAAASQDAAPKTESVVNFSNLFDDRELSQLQQSLEGISQQASQVLARLSGA